MHETVALLTTLGFPPIRRHRLESLQLNLGYRCNTLSADWQGDVYDCDFNQMLKLPMRLNGHARVKLPQLIEHDRVPLCRGTSG